MATIKSGARAVPEGATIIGRNVFAKTDGNVLWVGCDTTVKSGHVTEKGNETVATVGGRVAVAGGFLNFTFYKAQA